jgi:hypothetical protein
MQVNRGAFLMFLIFFMFFAPAGNPPRLMSPRERGRLRDYFKTEEYHLGLLANSTWSGGYGNLTGLTEPYPENPALPGSIIPKEIYEEAVTIWNSEDKSDFDEEIREKYGVSSNKQLTYYSNISSSLKGEWKARDISLIPIEMPIPGSKEQGNDTLEYGDIYNTYNTPQLAFFVRKPGNRTEKVGKFAMSINEYAGKETNVSLVSMDISMSNGDEDDGDNLRFIGIRIKETGNVVLTSSSLKFAGSYALPHLLLTENHFSETRSLMTRKLNSTLELKKQDPSYAFLEEAELLANRCEYVVYGHIHSTGLSPEQLGEIEDELDHPLGRPHNNVPRLIFDGILYSPDCGLAISVTNAEGEKYEQYFIRMRRTIMVGIILLLAQTIFTAIQMKDTNTPSTISRVSFYTIALMAILDGATCMSALVSSFLEQIALPFMAVAFISFALTSLFEIRYMVLIFRSQMMESIADERARQATSGEARFVARADGTIGNANSTQTLPTTETPVEQDERQIMGVIYSRFYFTLLGFLIVSLTTPSWPLIMRRIYEYASISILFAFWVPQIHRNVMRGSRKSFLWKFIFATSILRVIPVLYLCLDQKNVLGHHYDPILACVVVGWLGLQIAILFAQAVFGPRFFLPRGWLPVLYDYHPVITEEDLETGFNFGTDADTGTGVGEDESAKSNDSRDPLLSNDRHSKTDCAICMMPVELLVVAKESAHVATTPASMLARRRYMVTPCRHVFHTECMEEWMRTRLQCPVCRNPLPPI